MDNWPEGQPSRGSEPGDIPAWADAEPVIEARSDEMASEALRAAVNKERDRRITKGNTFTVDGYGDVPLTGRERDQTVYLALLVQAQGALAQGITTPVHTLRDAADTIHTLTPAQMIDLIGQAMGWFEDVMQTSWDMKDGGTPFDAGIPADYTDDRHWP
ncbi:hypothetical protein AY599_18260 [Leptolyngbya valderiana BDU 20041]|nr:hypothetical protein AY599_18260 [Leptolyngbya valderiana BDU 20041]